MKFFNDLILQIRRFKRANNLGFSFVRTKTFELPTHLKIGKRKLRVFLPDEKGIIELFRDILLDDEYWLECIPVHEIKSILDIGANVGIFSMAARIRFPESSIHAYEPNLQVKKHLDHQASAFGFKVMYEAIGSREGKGNLIANRGCDTAAQVNVQGDGNITITSLSKAIDQHEHGTVDLLKLDCEGHEHQIIDENQATQVLNRCRYISMEYHLGPEMRQCQLTRKLEAIGFEILKTSSRNQVIGNILAKNVR